MGNQASKLALKEKKKVMPGIYVCVSVCCIILYARLLTWVGFWAARMGEAHVGNVQTPPKRKENNLKSREIPYLWNIDLSKLFICINKYKETKWKLIL